MTLSVKTLETAGIGVIRKDLIKSSILGKTYQATAYYGENTVEIEVFYYRYGGSKILGPATSTEESFLKLLEYLKRHIQPMIVDNHIIKILKAAFIFGGIITILNIAAGVRTIADITYIAVDLIAMLIIYRVYKKERITYVKKD